LLRLELRGPPKSFKRFSFASKICEELPQICCSRPTLWGPYSSLTGGPPLLAT
jgi:hypothetical protein